VIRPQPEAQVHGGFRVGHLRPSSRLVKLQEIGMGRDGRDGQPILGQQFLRPSHLLIAEIHAHMEAGGVGDELNALHPPGPDPTDRLFASKVAIAPCGDR